ncbi:MarR family transcriptional regulator [Enterococcus sp. JM4C]|uniref:MarR family winged helix-turn-helix transcriptional regulator n=1 Tax=Candidatus Enterococcus huntleyi TaxID=1857217 RepID=UPI00137AC31E|nr:MarR family transcriptional regulator [Enterococcus sp. JM4C]KAF1296665.1 MarR family transcriptional regulator [Enterococcus sp. JM4C]
MREITIINHLAQLAHQPFLIFAGRMEDRTDNIFEAMRLLAEEEHVTAGRISEYLDIKPSSVTQIIKKLEEAGTVEKVKSTEDARVTFVRLTEKGREGLEEQGSISSELRKAVFKDFSEEELKELDEYMSRLVENVSGEEFYDKLNQIFGDDRRWRQFDKMSSRFSKAREQMMRQGQFGGFEEFHRDGFFRGRGRR